MTSRQHRLFFVVLALVSLLNCFLVRCAMGTADDLAAGKP